MIQIYEADNKKAILECKDRKLYENQVRILRRKKNDE
jgi:hypothetical protein